MEEIVMRVIIFLVGQYGLLFVFYPFKKFKVVLSKINYYLLFDSRYFTNNLKTESVKFDLFKSNKRLLVETQKHFRDLGYELLSTYSGLSFWSGFFFWNMPAKCDVQEAVGRLIRLSNAAGDSQYLLKNADDCDEIKRLLKLS